MYRILREKNEGLKGEAISFAQELTQTPSLSFEEGRAADLTERKMREIGYDEVLRDEAGNVVGLLLGREAAPTVMLVCHLDTVPPREKDQWRHSPHSGVMEGGRLYGLGAADCKGGLAAQVFTGALLRRSLLPLRGNLVVAATVGQEHGHSVGVRALMEKTLPELKLRPDCAILGEPTGLGLYYGHDGWMELEIRVEGANPFHVSDAARAIVNDLRPACGSVCDEEVALRRPRFEDVNGVRCARIPMMRRLGMTEALGDVLSQVKHNATLVAQASGSFAVDVLVRQENQRLYTGRTTLVRHVTHAWSTDPFHPLVDRARKALTAAGCEARPGKWQLDRLGMGTAGDLLVKEFKTPTIGYGPGTEEAAHARDEFVESGKITEAVYGTAAVVHSLIGIPVFGWTSDEI